MNPAAVPAPAVAFHAAPIADSVAPAAQPGEVTIFTLKMSGRFKAVAGAHSAWGDYATTAARSAAALHFGVPEDRIEVEPVNATLKARVRS